MHLLVTYDIAVSGDGPRRLRRVARTCEDFGQRVQFSVFECLLAPAEFVVLKAKLLDIVDLNQDSIRFYNLGAEWNGRVEHYGAKSSWDPGGPLVV